MPQASSLDSGAASALASGDRLESWKEIAAYLKRGVTTVQRWEQQEGLPIHRLQHDMRGSIYAFKSELDAWRAARHPPADGANSKDHDVGENRRSSWPHPATLTTALCAVASALALGVAFRFTSSTAQPPPISTIQISPAEELLEGPGPVLALSPDGRRLVYVGRHDGVDQLYLRRVDDVESAPLRGTERARSPFFSPDGKWIGFFADSQIKKVSLEGGGVKVVCATPGNAAGGSWGPNDTIVFSGFGHGLRGVTAAGGQPYQITVPDTAAGEVDHRWPDFLPGGAAVVFTIWNGSTNTAQIAVQTLGTEHHSILVPGTQPRVIGAKHILFVRSDGLWAAAIDPARLGVSAGPVRLLDTVLPRHGGAADYGTGRNGAFAYAPSRLASRNIVEFVDQHGRSTPITQEGFYSSPRLSPDGKRLAVLARSNDGGLDVWIYNLAGGGRARLPTGSSALDPIWTPDGKAITYASSKNGPTNLYLISADGAKEPELLLNGEFGMYPLSWSPTEPVLAFHKESTSTGHDIWLLSPGGRPSPFLSSPFGESRATFSPDGGWLAYVSDQSGQNEVYVLPYRTGGKPQRLSKGGGDQPVWSRDATALYHRGLSENLLFKVAAKLTPDMAVGQPIVVLGGPYELRTVGGAGAANYDRAPDGRFVMIRKTRQPVRQEIRIDLDGISVVKRSVPPK